MKSSQSKTTQPPSINTESAGSSSVRNREESLSSTSKREQQQNEAFQNSSAENISSAGLSNREGFSSQREQGHYQPEAESFQSYEGGVDNFRTLEDRDYSAQYNANARRRGGQQYQQGNFAAQQASDLAQQSGMAALMETWAGLVLGQVQITTQAAIRMAQCCFSPSLVSGITEVQRRYAEDSISNASAIASRLAQFTPRALNQNAQQQSSYSQPQSQEYQQRQQRYS